MPIAATSLKLPEDLKQRIDRLAKRAGETPHALMMQMLKRQVSASASW